MPPPHSVVRNFIYPVCKDKFGDNVCKRPLNVAVGEADGSYFLNNKLKLKETKSSAVGNICFPCSLHFKWVLLFFPNIRHLYSGFRSYPFVRKPEEAGERKRLHVLKQKL